MFWRLKIWMVQRALSHASRHWEKKKSRFIKHENNYIKIAASRELLSQQKTLSQNTEELQSTEKKKPFTRKMKELATFFHKLFFFPFFAFSVLHFLSLRLFQWPSKHREMLVCHQELTVFPLLPVVNQMSWYHQNWNSKANFIQWWEENLVAINFNMIIPVMIIPVTAKPGSQSKDVS